MSLRLNHEPIDVFGKIFGKSYGGRLRISILVFLECIKHVLIAFRPISRTKFLHIKFALTFLVPNRITCPLEFELQKKNILSMEPGRTWNFKPFALMAKESEWNIRLLMASFWFRVLLHKTVTIILLPTKKYHWERVCLYVWNFDSRVHLGQWLRIVWVVDS